MTASNSSVASVQRAPSAPEPAAVHEQPLAPVGVELPPCPAAPVVATPPVPGEPAAPD
jgi:hypothetical protein